MNYGDFFRQISGIPKDPFPYQQKLAERPWPETRIVPTGFGKTAAVLVAWLWKIAQGDAGTPRRLVYCLPMRSLVEQTEAAAKEWIGAVRQKFALEIQLEVLMGGRSVGRRGRPEWILSPEKPTILIGTQDILVSAALMRGYGVSRYRWPVDFALLHNDALWVFDEVQLTGAALATSAQLEAFRRKLEVGRTCHTLWMSATLDPAWLRTVDFTPTDTYRPHDLEDSDLEQAEQLWTANKRLERLDLSSGDIRKKEDLKAYAAELAKWGMEKAKPGTNTILFLNTVNRAQAVFVALKNREQKGELVLIHSRFRKADRDQRMKRLSKPPPAGGRIIVATQALEAGVDVSSSTMITELAPWSSLVQRFGRCNRYGECGETGANLFWVDLPDAEAKPYTPIDFADARSTLANLSACGPSDLATIPPSAPPRGSVVRKRDLFDLFDTDPDLSGFDVDVSLYVRDADDTDVRLFWRPVDGETPPPEATAPHRDELCPAPIGGAKQLLARKGIQAWRWDPLVKRWQRVSKDSVSPGMTLWVDAACGGYDSAKGFDAAATMPVQPVISPLPNEADQAIDDDEDTTSKVRVSLARHSIHVREEARRLAELLELCDNEQNVIVESALWHDLGKAHAVFKARCGLTPADLPLAKTPDYDWRSKDKRNRQYFRHELASALVYLASCQWHTQADLEAYLIAAHHGKVRMRLRALPKERRTDGGKLFARGVWDGDRIPETDLGGVVVPATTLDLDFMQLGEGPCGPSWSARTQRLLKRHGPFRLAWFEAVVRIADWRASAAEEAVGHDDL